MIITEKIQGIISKRLRSKELEAEKLGLDCDLDSEYLESLVCEYCPVLGTKLDWDFKDSYSMDYPNLMTLDLDRKGVKGNVAWVAHKTTLMKIKFPNYTELEELVNYLKNPIKRVSKIEDDNQWCTDDFFMSMYLRVKRRCQKLNIYFELTPSYLESIWTNQCPVKGTVLNRISDTERDEDKIPGLIDIDSSKGYIPGNVVFVSQDIAEKRQEIPLEILENILTLWSKSRVLEEEKLQTF